MMDMSRLSIAELDDKKIALDSCVDNLAVEVAAINKELIGRFKTFRRLCFTPVEALELTRPARRGVRKTRDR